MITNIPKSENGPKNTYKTNKNTYIFTWNLSKNKFTLWKQVKDGYEKLKISDSPLGFYKYIDELET